MALGILVTFHAVFRLPAPMATLTEAASPLRLANPYGLFAVMTTRRDELVVEGSMDGATWVPYAFPFKPGDVAAPPRWATPHQPRLDWQMWFAALTTPEGAPWIYDFAYALLEARPGVLANSWTITFDGARDRSIVRIVRHRYRFSTHQEKASTGDWWVRGRGDDLAAAGATAAAEDHARAPDAGLIGGVMSANQRPPRIGEQASSRAASAAVTDADVSAEVPLAPRARLTLERMPRSLRCRVPIKPYKDEAPLNFDFRAEWAKRNWWMNLIFLFCVYMTLIYLPYDLFLKPVAADQEVWFGFVLHGWWAKATGLLHWLVYGAGAYGFWKMARWMWPWAAVYVAQVALSMLVWNLVDDRGAGWPVGIAAMAVFMLPAIALWRARPAFQPGVR